MPNVAESLLLPAFRCFPPASPAFASGPGKQKRPRKVALIRLKYLRNFGAGEGIRTLDPNLGKVPAGLSPGYPASARTLTKKSDKTINWVNAHRRVYALVASDLLRTAWNLLRSRV